MHDEFALVLLLQIAAFFGSAMVVAVWLVGETRELRRLLRARRLQRARALLVDRDRARAGVAPVRVVRARDRRMDGRAEAR